MTIQELKPGDEFYFASNKSRLFILLSFKLRTNGTILSVKCCVHGKLKPVYLGRKHEVVVLPSPVIKIQPDEYNSKD